MRQSILVILISTMFSTFTFGQNYTFDNLTSNLGGNKSLTFNVSNNLESQTKKYRFISRNPIIAGYPTYLQLERENQIGTWSLIMQFKDDKTLIGGPMATPGDYSLYVKNGILTEKVKVALIGTVGWADYVFEDNYELTPLAELEAFIKENKHLPNVPTELELKKSGIDMQEMFKIQMEKIEELTLYVIEQDKRIKKLENELISKN